jgi:hypothetical protein
LLGNGEEGKNDAAESQYEGIHRQPRAETVGQDHFLDKTQAFAHHREDADDGGAFEHVARKG